MQVAYAKLKVVFFVDMQVGWSLTHSCLVFNVFIVVIGILPCNGFNVQVQILI
jgi:hypothetical protein